MHQKGKTKKSRIWEEIILKQKLFLCNISVLYAFKGLFSNSSSCTSLESKSLLESTFASWLDLGLFVPLLNFESMSPTIIIAFLRSRLLCRNKTFKSIKNLVFLIHDAFCITLLVISSSQQNYHKPPTETKLVTSKQNYMRES